MGKVYEPYIFSALNSAKVMLCIGTKPEYFSAVWVKNEWSRYLALMKNDRTRSLIPCYRDMDAYDIPDELAILQSQDMSKIGFLQDLIRGIQKVLNTEKTQMLDVSIAQSSMVVAEGQVELGASNPQLESLLKRTALFLEDQDYGNVGIYSEKILDIDAECAMGYVYQICAEIKKSDLSFYDPDSFSANETQLKEKIKKLYDKAERFATPELKSTLAQYKEILKQRLEEEKLRYMKNNYELACNLYDEYINIFSKTKKEIVENKQNYGYTMPSHLSDKIKQLKKLSQITGKMNYEEYLLVENKLEECTSYFKAEMESGSIFFRYSIVYFLKISFWEKIDLNGCRQNKQSYTSVDLQRLLKELEGFQNTSSMLEDFNKKNGELLDLWNSDLITMHELRRILQGIDGPTIEKEKSLYSERNITNLMKLGSRYNECLKEV